MFLLSASGILGLSGRAWGQTYYVSPTGSDSNSGTSASSPWQTLTKVDDTTFAPGSQILFQDGGNWYGQALTASSSGTVSDPIIYGSYGTGANPTFWGSVIVPTASFTPIASEPDTYFYATNTTVNAFLINHQFTNNASLVSGQSSDAGNISYVESTPDTSYYDPDGSTPGLYVNTGSAINSSNVYTAAVVSTVINSNTKSNLTFENLTVNESAAYNSGYAFYAFKGSNITFLNDSSSGAGKHAFITSDTTGFVGENLTVSNLMPDQGFGGASAFVSYADASVSNTTATWTNITYNNPNDVDGAYPAFITHPTPSATNATPISSIVVQNLVTNSNPSMAIYTSGNETVNINGGRVSGDVTLYGNNTTINGMLLDGYAADVTVTGGTGNVIQNSIFTGSTPNWQAGIDGTIIDGGQGTIIRFNTIILGAGASSVGAAIALENNSTGTQIYGNIIDTPYAAIFQRDPGTPTINAYDNLVYAGSNVPQIIFFYHEAPTSAFASLPTTLSYDELFGNPNFMNLAGGNFYLAPDSVAAYVFDPATDEYVMYDYYGNVRPDLLASLGAIEIPEPSALGLLAILPLLARRKRHCV